MSRISVVVSPMVIVSMVSESGMEAGGLEVEMDDKLEYLGEDQSTVCVGVILIELTFWVVRITGFEDVLVIGIVPLLILTT